MAKIKYSYDDQVYVLPESGPGCYHCGLYSIAEMISAMENELDSQFIEALSLYAGIEIEDYKNDYDFDYSAWEKDFVRITGLEL